MSSEYILHCHIDPRKGIIKVGGTIIISSVEQNMFFVLNRGLRWTKTIRKTASGTQHITPSKSDAFEVPRFYNGDLWTFNLMDTAHDEFVIEMEYTGQIHPPSKDSGIPTMGYIKRDFVELACYSAWYPVPLNIETNMSFDLFLEGPSDWIWEVNGTLLDMKKQVASSVWHWKQNNLANDIIIIGLPKHLAYLQDDGLFWGPKDIVGPQRVLEQELSKMNILLQEWLGPRETQKSIRFIITPRAYGGAYARSGLVIIGGGYSTELSLRRSVLQSMCHELCHDWFCKASVKSYDNWVDEALAEYCSIMITEEYFNDGFFDWRIAKTKEKLEEQGQIPSIKSLTRDQEESYAAYYFRGFLLLNELAEFFGRREFQKIVGEFAQFCIRNKNITSEMFLEFMENKIGEKARVIANRWLNYDGVGIPPE